MHLFSCYLPLAPRARVIFAIKDRDRGYGRKGRVQKKKGETSERSLAHEERESTGKSRAKY